MAIGVPRPLAIEKPQAVDLVQAARYFGAHGEPDAATLALLQKCAVPLLAAAMPRAVWLLADTPALTEAGILPGEDVHKHLAGCGQAILLAVTLGPGVDAQIRRAGVGDIAAGVASDALGSALAEQAADAAEAQLRQWAATEGKYLTGRFSPGYGDLGHRGAAAGGSSAGHRAQGRAVRHRHQPDDPAQERDRPAGGQRPPGKRTTGRVRPLCAAHPLRIQKEGKDLCK